MTKTLPMAKNMLITGAAQRIGAALAGEMAAEGWHVCIHYNTSQAKAEKVADAIISKGGKASLYHADLATTEGPEDLIARCHDEIGPLSCLINNASIFENDNLNNFTDKSFTKHLNVNLKAPALLTQSFSRYVRNSDGIIINIIDCGNKKN